jgi:RHS repeat-associated protein
LPDAERHNKARAERTLSHADHLATPRLVADENQKTVWRWDQAEPFGDNPANEDPDGDGVAFDLPLRFPGQYYDKETGLSQNWFRDYDAGIGRYTRSDPIGLAGGLNTFAYVGADPLSYIDISGLAKVCANLRPAPFNPNDLPSYCKALLIASGVDQDIETTEKELDSFFKQFRWKNPKPGLAPDPRSGDPRSLGRTPPVKPEIQVDWYAVYMKLIKTTVTFTYQPWARYDIYCERGGDCGQPVIRYNYQKTSCQASWSKTNESTGWQEVEKFLGRFSIDWFLP